MPGGFASRFAIEAGFLILLGVGAGLAHLRTLVIVAVLAAGWLLVSLIELTVWRVQAPPVAPHIPPPAEPVLEPVAESALSGANGAEPSPDGSAYPLRADAGSVPSEEVEAYTHILDPEPEGDPPGGSAE